MTATMHVEYKCDYCGHNDTLDIDISFIDEYYFSPTRLDYEGDVNYHIISVDGRINLACDECLKTLNLIDILKE